MVITMNCPKCNGFMMYEKFMDMEASSRFFFYGWRCITCGNIVDRTIITNKVVRPARKTKERQRRLKKAG